MVPDAPARCSKILVMPRLSRNLCWIAANLIGVAALVLKLVNPTRPLLPIFVMLGAAVVSALRSRISWRMMRTTCSFERPG
jgi:hypothetical protein